MAMWTIIAGACLVVSQTTAQSNDLQGSLGRCIGQDAQRRDQCLVELAEKLRPFMTTGITIGGVEVPKTEPMFIPKVNLELKVPGLVDIKNELTSILVTGLSKFNLKSVTSEKRNNEGLIHTNISIPALVVIGDANIEGNVANIVFDKTKRGSIKVDLTDIDVSVVLRMINRNGRLVIVDDPEIETEIGNMKIKFDKLFPGQFGTTVESFFNDKKNNKKFIKDFKPQIQKQIGSLAKNVYNAAVKDVDASVFDL